MQKKEREKEREKFAVCCVLLCESSSSQSVIFAVLRPRAVVES